MRRVNECTRYYTVMRAKATDCEWMVNVEEVEQVEMTWTEFVKYVKKHYELVRTDKRHGGVAWVK